MKTRTIAALAVVAMGFCTTTQAANLQAEGQDKRLEWTVKTEWKYEGKALDIVHSLDGKYAYILTAEGTVDIYTTEGRLQGSLPVGKSVSAIDIAPQGETLYLIDNDQNTFTSVAVSFVVEINNQGSIFKGPEDAPVTITLFTDFECPWCRKIAPVLDEVVKRNPDTVRLVFKNMPLRFHKLAEPAARAALAANEQGKFWEFHDRLFAENELTEEKIAQVAKDLQLDMAQLQKDMKSVKVNEQLRQDVMEAQRIGVTGTPAIFINGRTPRQRSLEGFQAIIDEELQKAGK